MKRLLIVLALFVSTVVAQRPRIHYHQHGNHRHYHRVTNCDIPVRVRCVPLRCVPVRPVRCYPVRCRPIRTRCF